jgi:hypothetical protein
MKDRGVRRSQEKRIKTKYKKVAKSWGGFGSALEAPKEPSPREVGMMAAVHGKGCSCSMCGNPRKTHRGKSALTMQELRKFQVEE